MKDWEYTYQMSIWCQTVREQNSEWTGQVTEGLEKKFLFFSIQHFNRYKCKKMIHTDTKIFFRICSSEKMLRVVILCSTQCEQCIAVVKNVNLVLRCMKENKCLDFFFCKRGMHCDLPSLLIMLPNSNHSQFMFWPWAGCSLGRSNLVESKDCRRTNGDLGGFARPVIA